MKSLFLDRDGVINVRLVDQYIDSWATFQFAEGALEAIRDLSAFFDYLFIVTNQQGIGRGLMTHADLSILHEQMINEISSAGGHIDKVYYCPGTTVENPLCRKPNPGMGLEAKRDFPDVEFYNSWMVGDMPTDILFGKRLGMKTVLITDQIEYVLQKEVDPDYYFSDLLEFSQHIKHFYL
jgi:histidinol-phosphate phosphatase family protein